VIRLALPVVALLAGCWNKPVHVDIRSGKVCIKRVKISDSEFHWHSDVERRSHSFGLFVRSVNLLEGLTETFSTSQVREFRSFHRLDEICIRTIARAYSGNSSAEFWVHVVYGHSGDSRPTYVREPLRIDVTGGGVIHLDRPAAGMPIAHGQGLPIKHFRFNCTTGGQESPAFYLDIGDRKAKGLPPFWSELPAIPWWIPDPHIACANVAVSERKRYENFEQTKYTPAFPAMTGGQHQFGVYQCLPEMHSDGYRLGSWKAQLYQEGCRPAHFLHPDGSRVTEDDYPLTVLTSSGWIHERSDGKYWIKHTNPSAHWKDKGAATPGGTTWRFWDSQHWSVNALVQAHYLYQVDGVPDPGLDLLLRDLAEGWLWSNPVIDKGTTHHHVPGSARARGRILESGCALAAVLDGDIKERLIKRVEALLDIQLQEFRRCLAANESPLVSRKDGIAPWEHGLWVKGLYAATILLPHRTAEISEAGAHIARWVLGSFKEYDGKLYIPYVIKPSGKWGKDPSKQLTLWCLPAVQLLHRFGRTHLTQLENRKVSRILDQFATEAPPPSGGWTSALKWTLF